MFAKITYKRIGTLAVKAAIILNNFGICCAYFRIFGDVCSSLVALLVEDKSNFFCNNWNNFFYVICVCILMFPFIFRENIESLEVI
jgi:amino acid permease